MNPQSVHWNKKLGDSKDYFDSQSEFKVQTDSGSNLRSGSEQRPSHKHGSSSSSTNKSEADRRTVLIIVTGGHLLQRKGKHHPNEAQDLKKQLENDKDFHHPKLPKFDILMWSPLIKESSTMEQEHMIKLALEIKQYYYDYDGFIVIHGVRTMVYTACYLSFMLENLGKCVVLTDAYLPLADVFTDAKTNLLSSLLISARTDIAEVCICFNKKVFRGNRAVRADNSSPDMFISPNIGPIAQFIPNLRLSKHRISQLPKKRFQLQTRLFTNIIIIYVQPSMSDEMFKAILHGNIKSSGFVTAAHVKMQQKAKTVRNNNNNNNSNNNNNNENDSVATKKTIGMTDGQTESSSGSGGGDSDIKRFGHRSPSPVSRAMTSPMKLNKEKNINMNAKGVILSFYGVGNGPERPSFKKIISDAISKYNCEIVVTSQPLIGTLNLGVYGTAQALFGGLPIMSGMDMTNECMTAKLSYLMGKGYRGSKLHEEFGRNMCGEFTPSHEIAAKTVNYKRRLQAKGNILGLELGNDVDDKFKENLIQGNRSELIDEKAMINETEDTFYKTSEMEDQLNTMRNALYDRTMQNMEILKVGDIKVSASPIKHDKKHSSSQPK